MDFWAENRGHLPQYSKFNTLPSRSYAQNYHDRHPPPQYHAYCEEQRAKSIDAGYYWPPRDTANWSNQEPPASPSQFPFHLDHRTPPPQGEQRHELHDWPTLQPQERGLQHEAWSYHPAHYKRELSKRNDNNFRELEAWALRYSHSLPRRRRIEAELRGAMQDHVERRGVRTANVQEAAVRDRASRQQALNYYQTVPQGQNLDVRDKINYQTKLYSHPPNYNAPPSYSVQYRNVSMPHTLAKPSHELPQVVKKTEKERYEKSARKIDEKALDILQGRHLVHRRSSSDAAKIIEGRKFQLNKKAGGLTIFCLVSRIADADTENAPTKQNEVAHPKASDVSPPSKLADEVDFKTPTAAKHARSPYSKLQAIPICKESLCKMAQRSNEVSAVGKLAAKFPLWRRPSFTSSVESDNACTTCSKEILEKNLQGQENDSKTGNKMYTESQNLGRKDGGATLVTDTTCVVVKMEMLKEPKKEQVHYLSSDDQSETGQKLANEDNSPEQQDTGPTVEMLPEQADCKFAVEGTKSKDDLPTNSETLVERAKRICGLRESTTTQQGEDFDFAVEDLTKQNKDANQWSGETSQEESMNASSIGKDGNVPLLQVRSCKDEEMETRTEPGEVNEPKESLMEKSNTDFPMDNEMQTFKMDRAGQCEESDKGSDSIAISNTLDLKIEEQHFEDVSFKMPESEVDDTEKCIKHEEIATQPILMEAKVEPLSGNVINLQDEDQEVKKELTEGSHDLVAEMENAKVSELNWPVSVHNGKDVTSGELEMHEEPNAQVTAVNNLQQVDSVPLEEAPTLEKSENEQKQSVKLIETDNDELHGCDVDTFNSDPEAISGIEEVDDDDDIEEEKGVETITEIKESGTSTHEEPSDAKEQKQEHFSEASKENVQDYEGEIEHELKQQFECNDEASADEEELIVNNEESAIITNVQDKEIEPTALTDQEQMSEDLVELLDDAKANLIDLEMQKNIELNDDTGLCEEERANCANETVISVQNVEVDHVEVEREVVVVKDIVAFDLQDEEEREEIIVAETRSSAEDGEPANEAEKTKDTDSEEQVSDLDVRRCDWSDAITDAAEDELNVEGAEKRDGEICQCTGSEERLQPQVHPIGKNTTDSSLVCPSSACENDGSEEEGKCPKSLWDAVNRIRKHTAPDSENEEEEVMESWDKESFVGTENVFDSVDVDFMQAEQSYGDSNEHDDACSQCSDCSQESDGTIVDDDLEEMAKVEAVDVYDGNQSSDGEGKGQNDAQNEDTVKQNQIEEFVEERWEEEAEML